MFKSAVCLAALCAGLSCLAQAAGPALYPVRQLIGYGGDATQKKLLDPLFVAALESRGAAHYVQLWQDEFARQFAERAATTIDGRNRLKTFAASLQLTRASHYQVPGLDGTVTHFLPLTLALHISNPLTGEVVYSTSKTRYELFKVMQDSEPDAVRQQAISLYQANVQQVIKSLVAEAARNFRPLEVSATLTQTWQGLYVLDRGQDAGLAAGDDVQDASGNLLKLVHAGRSYAVAEPVLVGKLDKGTRFSRYVTMSVNDIRKPRLLILPDAAREDGGDDVVNELFAQLLPAQTAFSLMPVNRNHQQVLDALARDTDIGQSVVKQNRALPDFFIRLHTAPRLIYELPTNSATVVHRLYEASAFGEVLDASGRVVFASSASSRIDDEVVNGSGFDMAAREQILLKNVLQELADRFGREVNFRSISASVTRVDGEQVWVEDSAAALEPGMPVRIFRTLDSRSGEAVQVPIWEGRVQSRAGNTALVQLVLPQTSALRSSLPQVGDSIVSRRTGRALATDAVRVQMCAGGSQQQGDWQLPAFGLFAYYAAAEHGQLPFYTRWQETAASIDQLTRYAGFRAPVQTYKAPDTAWCLQPASKIEVLGRECTDGRCTVSFSANLALGLRGPAGGKPRWFGQKITPVLRNVPAAYIDAVMASQLQQVLPGLLRDAARRVGPEAVSAP